MPRVKFVSAAIYFNKYKPQKDGKCPISIRITFDREKRFYDTGFRLAQTEFDDLFAQKLKPSQKKIKSTLDSFEVKAIDCIYKLSTAFTFSGFERIYLSNRALSDSLYGAFEDYIAEIEPNRIGTILTYRNTRDSFEKFRPKAKIADVSVRFLNEFEEWMISKANL